MFDFKQSVTNGNADVIPNETELREWVKEQLNLNKKYGMAFVSATLNDSQVVPRRVLYKLGFRYSGWMGKVNHPETKVRLYWFPLEDWDG
jgi:hypothetical protein